MNMEVDPVSLDRTIIQVHSDGKGTFKNAPAIGKSRDRWSTRGHSVAADDQTVVTFLLSPGQAGDVPEGRKRLQTLAQTSGGKVHRP
ncbi:hypothetical protein AB835_11220 [Candidatus Endobugula sertula]|uniref:Transposase IS4-like domain-containing protein n=1 Tax=Candidatus Endobugula sertula TaxID=62101 RepID=A0A1D2QN62_9GAMM|nr:hypothetical protein AB835_11220 [Candidatus Endobugula sertula]